LYKKLGALEQFVENQKSSKCVGTSLLCFILYFLNLEDPQPKDIEDLHAAYTRDLVRKETSVAPERNESGSRGRGTGRYFCTCWLVEK
jgi:hypothetical protein